MSAGRLTRRNQSHHIGENDIVMAWYLWRLSAQQALAPRRKNLSLRGM